MGNVSKKKLSYYVRKINACYQINSPATGWTDVTYLSGAVYDIR